MAAGDTKTFQFTDPSSGFLATLTVVDNGNGSLTFTMDVDETGGVTGDTRAIYFNLTDDQEISNLAWSVDASSDVGQADVDVVQSIDGVRYVEEKDTNISGTVLKENDGKFDLGIEFGSSGIGQDDVQHMEFTLSGDGLTLDDLDLSSIGFRATSVGDVDGGRNGSLKLTGEELSTVVAKDDAAAFALAAVQSGDAVFEDSILLNDFDPEGDTFDIISASGADGTDTAADDSDAMGSFFSVAGDNGGVFQVYTDGTVLLTDPNGDFVSGFPIDTSITYTIEDDTGATDSAVVTATVDEDAGPPPPPPPPPED